MRCFPRRPQAGVTLFEAVVCVAILTLGIVLVAKPLLFSLESLQNAEYRSAAHRLIHNKLWDFQEDAIRMERIPMDVPREMVQVDDCVLHYGIHAMPLTRENSLYRVTGTVMWRIGKHTKKIHRVIYVGF